MTSPDPPLRRAAGPLLAIMVVATVANSLWPDIPIIIAPVLAWLAGISLWAKVGKQQRLQVVVLIVLGVAGALWGALHGVEFQLERTLGQNQLIISMIASVGLLQLLNQSARNGGRELPRGMRAYVRSMFGVHLFAAVINISALVMMADRLASASGLSRAQAQLLSRAFTMAAFYSPFIGGVALALAYTPGSSLPVLLLFGIPLALCGFAALYVFARTGQVERINEFSGYPVHFDSLWLPALLACAVVILHLLAPRFSILALIIMLTPVIVVLVLVLREGPAGTARMLGGFVRTGLPGMAGELALFLSAGVFAAGLVALFASSGGWVPFERLDATTASLVLIVTLAVSVIGIHPVIVVSTIAPLLAPIRPDPTLLAMVFVMGWGIGCGANPLSGTNLTLHGRYGVNNWQIGRDNIGFGLILCVCAIGFFHLYAATIMPDSG